MSSPDLFQHQTLTQGKERINTNWKKTSEIGTNLIVQERLLTGRRLVHHLLYEQ